MNQMADTQRRREIWENDYSKNMKNQTGYDLSWCACFVSFYKDVLSQALTEDAAWDFLTIFTDDFYSPFLPF